MMSVWNKNDREIHEGDGGSVLDTLGDGKVLEVDRDNHRVTLEFTVKPEFCHSGGIAQGGFVTGWIDSAMAHAAIGTLEGIANVATLEVKVSFLKATVPNQQVRAVGWIKKSGRSVAFMEGELYSQEGRLLATSSSTGMLIPKSASQKSEETQGPDSKSSEGSRGGAGSGSNEAKSR